jgi:hypothetical protein
MGVTDVASLMISPADARCTYYSAISALGVRSSPARARVNGAMIMRLGSSRSPIVIGSKRVVMSIIPMDNKVVVLQGDVASEIKNI